MQKEYKECSIKSLLKKTLEYKRELITGNLFALLATLATVIVPLFIPLLIDELLLNKDPKLTKFVATYISPMTIVGYVAFFLVFIIILRYLSTYFGIMQVKKLLIVAKGVSFNVRSKAIDYLKSVTLKEYEKFSPGAMTSKLVTDINTIDEFIATVAGKIIISTLILIFVSVILLIINWKLALFIIITNPIVVYFTAKLSKRVGKLKREENRAVEDFQDTLNDTLEMYNQIKAVNKEEYFLDTAKVKANSLKEKSVEFSYKTNTYAKISYFTFLTGYELFRSASILAVAYSDLSIGMMLAIFGYLWIMSNPTFDIINFQYSLASAKAACKRVEEIFSLEQERDVKTPKGIFDIDSVDIEISSLNFAYNSGSREILKDLKMQIRPRQKVALVGPSGSGKSTLANIIAGLYEPTSGDIKYNSVSYKSINPKTIRENIYLIMQHPKLFNDTMRFNLTLGKDCSPKEIEYAIRVAQLKEVIESLDNGLNTVVGKDGVKLSGGQRQRVAIARMILEDPDVVIFDESTSALDIHTESRLFKELHEYLEKKSVITIAHRLSTVEKAEYIFVLEDGSLVEQGTPQELLSKELGYFASMV